MNLDSSYVQTTTILRCTHADSVAGEGQIETHYLFIATFQLTITVCVICATAKVGLKLCMHFSVS